MASCTSDGSISRRSWGKLCLTLLGGISTPSTLAARRVRSRGEGALIRREFIAEEPRQPSCHASTIVESRRGLLVAWFAGTAEGNNDVCIYAARLMNGAWTEPFLLAEGVGVTWEGRHPCWNPVLFQPARGPLLLFYKVGPRPSTWWGMVRSSKDGIDWAPPHRLPPGHMGPVRAKPVQLPDGTILCGSSTEDQGWRVQMESTRNPLADWQRTAPLNDANEWGAIQPTLLVHSPTTIQILCRSRQRVVLESWSHDGGKTWSRLQKTALPNPNSGIDAVRLRDGRFLLVYNHASQGRDLLNLAVSRDGRDWRAAMVLEQEPGEFSYPAMIQGRNGDVHITYTWKRRRIRHVVVDAKRIEGYARLDSGRWPS